GGYAGRRPTSGEPQGCEGTIGGTGTPTRAPELGLVPVGRAARTDPLPRGGTFDPGNDKPLLLVGGVAAGARIGALDQFQRTYGWVAPLDLDRVRQLGVDGYLARSARAPDDPAQWRPGLTLTAPDDVLRDEDA